MENNNIIEIRGRGRQIMQDNRRQNRLQLINRQRPEYVDPEELLNVENIKTLCNRIKRKKKADIEDLSRFALAFFQSNENIKAFANTIGAIDVVIKELTGQDSERQIYAAQALCHLSLGEDFVCKKIALKAGSYLLLFLDSADCNLKLISLWTLINIVATDSSCMLEMNIVSKMLHLFFSTNQLNVDLLKDISLCLNLLFKNNDIEILREHFEPICAGVKELTLESPQNKYLMEFLFNSSILTSNYQFEDEVLTFFADIIQRNIGTATKTHLNILYEVRFLSNLTAIYKNNFFSILEKKFEANSSQLCDFMNFLFSFRNLDFRNEVFWLLKNILCAIDCEIKKSEFVGCIIIV